jgi:hypothetical protein
MTSIDSLYQRLLITASLLDTAAGEIRDIPLSPAKENIRHIGGALAEIYELLRAVYAVRPDLVPVEFGERKADHEANTRLTPVLSEAYRLVEAGSVAQAIALLERYAETESSVLHRRIALDEIEHFRTGGDT